MPHEDPISSPTAANHAARDSASPTPTNLRRVATIDEAVPRRRPAFSPVPGSTSADGFDGPRRRASTLSEFNLAEAQNLFNPKPVDGQVDTEESSNWASVPLAFALLPALGGVLFKNGSAIVTDVMLLGLAAVFLHWSVTQPWNWYHSAQQVRIREGLHVALDTEEESETERIGEETGHNASGQATAGSEHEAEGSTTSSSSPRTSGSSKADAMAELYTHELFALVSCFMCPIVGAYLLHAIRAQLSRPSEGLVSNYNLTIFLLAAELRPLSHLMRLVQSRTLYLQRQVHENHFTKQDPPSTAQTDSILERLQELEIRSFTAVPANAKHGNGTAEGSRAKQDATIVRDVRNLMQPDLDALNRAVRRYEKKATLLSLQTESRFVDLEMRLNDAIALAAAAAKHSTSQPSFVPWLAASCLDIMTLPLRSLFSLFLFPFRTILGMIQGKKVPQSRSSRNGRGYRSSGHQSRSGSDRPPSRISRR